MTPTAKVKTRKKRRKMTKRKWRMRKMRMEQGLRENDRDKALSGERSVVKRMMEE
jgi:hypothetical protein